jgi:Sec-independent protein secretion pathway component TatC
MVSGIASILAQNVDSMPLLAHLEELRKRIILAVAGVVVGFFDFSRVGPLLTAFSV